MEEIEQLTISFRLQMRELKKKHKEEIEKIFDKIEDFGWWSKGEGLPRTIRIMEFQFKELKKEVLNEYLL